MDEQREVERTDELEIEQNLGEQVEELDQADVHGESGGLWRQRAAESAARLAELEGSLAAAERATAVLQQTVEEVGRARLVDIALLRAGVSDLDAAREAIAAVMSTQRSGAQKAQAEQIAEPASEKGMTRVVDQLRRERPGLFSGGSAIAAHASGAAGEVGLAHEAVDAAQQARSTGDRRQLLRYLRLRRTAH